MSRSYKKTPIIGHAGSSDKQDKRKANRNLRRQVKESLAFEDYNLPLIREVSDVYSFSKDGKFWYAYIVQPGDKIPKD